MKIKTLLIAFVACLFVQVFTSCTRITDAQISSLEKSIEKLEKNYKDLTKSQLEKTVMSCQSRLERLREKELTINQKERLNKLDWRLSIVKIKIGWNELLNEIRESVSLNKIVPKYR